MILREITVLIACGGCVTSPSKRREHSTSPKVPICNNYDSLNLSNITAEHNSLNAFVTLISCPNFTSEVGGLFPQGRAGECVLCVSLLRVDQWH